MKHGKRSYLKGTDIDLALRKMQTGSLAHSMGSTPYTYVERNIDGEQRMVLENKEVPLKTVADRPIKEAPLESKIEFYWAQLGGQAPAVPQNFPPTSLQERQAAQTSGHTLQSTKKARSAVAQEISETPVSPELYSYWLKFAECFNKEEKEAKENPLTEVVSESFKQYLHAIRTQPDLKKIIPNIIDLMSKKVQSYYGEIGDSRLLLNSLLVLDSCLANQYFPADSKLDVILPVLYELVTSSTFHEDSIKNPALLLKLKEDSTKLLESVIYKFKSHHANVDEAIQKAKLKLLETKTDYLCHMGPLKLITDLDPSDLRSLLLKYITNFSLPSLEDQKLMGFKNACQEICIAWIKKQIHVMYQLEAEQMNRGKEQEFNDFKEAVMKVFPDKFTLESFQPGMPSL